jgi:hypothetical protein
MRKSYLIAAGLLLALGGAAEAKGPSAVGGGMSSPPGFSSPGGRSGFDKDTSGGTTISQPKGWDQPSNAWWKDTTDATQPLPPGISGTNK